MIIVDKKLDTAIKDKLRIIDEVYQLETHGITYEAISGHPDIFFCKTDMGLISAPQIENLPFKTEKGIAQVGKTYPDSARYNAVITPKYLIHNTQITDKLILYATVDKEHIHINQGYSRCSLLAINDKLFITSDQGIFGTLKARGFNVLHFDPKDIILPGFAHGFFGGCCGIINEKVVFTGSLKYHKDGDEVKKAIQKTGNDVLELNDSPLFDCGSLLKVK